MAGRERDRVCIGRMRVDIYARSDGVYNYDT